MDLIMGLRVFNMIDEASPEHVRRVQDRACSQLRLYQESVYFWKQFTESQAVPGYPLLPSRRYHGQQTNYSQTSAIKFGGYPPAVFE
jgi:hypothetical protein